jgi:hypothetical protein
MTEYICLDCLKNFGNSKSHFERHLNKKKSCKINNIFTPNLHQISNNLHQITPLCIEKYKNKKENKEKSKEESKEENKEENIFLCEYCQKIFSRKFCLDRHINGRCKEKVKLDEKNKKKDIIEDKKINIIIKQNEELKKVIKELKTNNKIFKNQLMEKKNNPNINIIVNNNIVNFNNIDYNNIDKKLFINPLMDTRLYGKSIILKMIENIYINEDLSIYHNIIITDKNRGYVKIYENGKWKTDNIQIINLVLDGIITYSKSILNELNKEYINNNKAKNRINTSKKYVELCDLEYLNDLEDEQINDEINNKDKIQRCKDFREMIFKDTINLFHDNKNIILKPKNNKLVEI